MCIIFWYQNDEADLQHQFGSSDSLVELTHENLKTNKNKTKVAESILDPEILKSLINWKIIPETKEEYVNSEPDLILKNNFKLIIASNRDEYYERPTEPLHLWKEDDCDIVAAKDLKGGGTWLGWLRSLPIFLLNVLLTLRNRLTNMLRKELTNETTRV